MSGNEDFAEQVLRLSLSASLTCWFTYDDETGELEITPDWPDEPSIPERPSLRICSA